MLDPQKSNESHVTKLSPVSNSYDYLFYEAKEKRCTRIATFCIISNIKFGRYVMRCLVLSLTNDIFERLHETMSDVRLCEKRKIIRLMLFRWATNISQSIIIIFCLKLESFEISSKITTIDSLSIVQSPFHQIKLYSLCTTNHFWCCCSIAHIYKL